MKPWLKDVIACTVIYLAVALMFNEIVFMGKEFSKGDDTEAATALDQFAKLEADSTDYPLWCSYLFGGFPSFAAGAYSNYHYIGFPYALVKKWISPEYWLESLSRWILFFHPSPIDNDSIRWVGRIFIGALFMYVLMRRLRFDVIISLLCALIMAWNPYLISLATAAHGGKLMTFIYLPLIILLAWNLLERRGFFDAGLLALVFGWQIANGGHTQILFYSGLTIGIIAVVWTIFEFKDKNPANVVKGGGLLAAAVVLAVGVGALWYIPLYSYLPYSIRGMGPAVESAQQSGYSLTDATMWSFPPSEIVTYIVPSWFGLKSPNYWGDMPFTSSSFYFGVVPLLFAVLALFGRKNRLMWGLIALAAVSLLLSFGKYFEIFYSIFFNYFPFFDKFRTPSLILLLFNLSCIVMAGYGILFVLDRRNDPKWQKVFLYGAIGAAAILLLVLVAGESLMGMFGSFVKEGETARYSASQIEQVRTMRFALLKKDLLLSMLWLALAFGVCYAYAKGKIKQTALTIGVLLITALDLWIFSNQFFDPQPKGSQLASLKPNKVVQALKADTTLYRIAPFGQISMDNRWATWGIQSFSGYHAAKMRSWQDLSDQVFFSGSDPNLPVNFPFFSAMNCKYLLFTGNVPPGTGLRPVAQEPSESLFLFLNPQAMERAYFADSVIVESDRARTIELMRDPAFNYTTTVITDESLPGAVRNGNRSVRITDYQTHRIVISATCSEPSFLVLSDAHYPPGWIAMIDNQPAHIYKVNGFVRGLYLEPGNHTIEYVYEGAPEKRGVAVAMTSYFVVVGIIAAGWFMRRRKSTT